MICQCQDDNGNICERKMTEEEYEQDGMCHICADSLWELYALPVLNWKEPKPFIHKRDENEK